MVQFLTALTHRHLIGYIFHTKYGVMALMHDYVRQANFASKPLL